MNEIGLKGWVGKRKRKRDGPLSFLSLSKFETQASQAGRATLALAV